MSSALTFALACALSASAGSSKLLVMTLEAEEGVSASVARQLDAALTTELAATGRYQVYAEADLVSMLELEGQKQVAGCADDSCIVEVGGALGAERVVYGTVGALGGTFVLSLKLINVRRGVAEGRFSEGVGDAGELLAAIERAVPALVSQSAPAATLAASSESAAAWTGWLAAATGGCGLLLVGAGAYEHLLARAASADIERFAAEGGAWTRERAEREAAGREASRRALVLDAAGLSALAAAGIFWWWLGDAPPASGPTFGLSSARGLTLGFGGAW